MQKRKFGWAASGLLLILAVIVAPVGATAQEAGKPAPLVIQQQGSFAVGGTVISNPGTFDPSKPNPAGQTFHGDHAYAFYQIPVNARRLPLVLWHGAGQFSKTWETTPDGREGYPDDLPAPRLRRVQHRSAATRQCRPQHRPGDDCSHARRTVLVRFVPHRCLAELLSRRAVLPRPGSSEPVFPLR